MMIIMGLIKKVGSISITIGCPDSVPEGGNNGNENCKVVVDSSV